LRNVLKKSAGADFYLFADTETRLRPTLRLLFKTARPARVDILSRKPCVLTRLFFEGWYVLFVAIINP